MEEKIRKPKNIFVEGPISTEKIAASIQNHSNKHQIEGHSIYLGQVKAETGAITFGADEEIALNKAFEIREAIFSKYDLTCMHIYHSLGKVEVGEIYLFLFTSSEYNRQAVDACSELVERINNELPIQQD